MAINNLHSRVQFTTNSHNRKKKKKRGPILFQLINFNEITRNQSPIKKLLIMNQTIQRTPNPQKLKNQDKMQQHCYTCGMSSKFKNSELSRIRTSSRRTRQPEYLTTSKGCSHEPTISIEFGDAGDSR